MKKRIYLVIATFILALALTSCSKEVEIDISFESNGGTEYSSTIFNENEDLASYIPTKLGYSFDGWYLDSNFNTLYDSNYQPSNDFTVYAKWKLDFNQNNTVMDNYIKSLMDNTSSFVPAWNKESFKGKWNYIDGVFLKSLLACYDDYLETNTTKANLYKNFIISYVNYYIDTDGSFICYSGSNGSYSINYDSPGYKSGELDTVCESQILFKLYEMTGDIRYYKAINYTYSELMKHGRLNESTDEFVNFEHKAVYANQIWLDGMFMYVPFYAEYAKMANDSTIYSKIKAQYQYIREHMFNEEKGLYYHGYDASIDNKAFWAKTDGTSKSFWLRSTGWFIVSLVDTIEYFPEGENKEYLKELLNEAITGIMKYQDNETKMFYQVIDLGKTSLMVSKDQFSASGNKSYQVNGSYADALVENYVEASGSSMISYACLKGSRLGYLPSSYQEVGALIYKGIYNHSLSIENNSINLKDICITAGLGDSSGLGRLIRDGSAEYYLSEKVGENDAKGVGPFIMAYIEYSKIK